jgi:hypothetical protein
MLSRCFSCAMTIIPKDKKRKTHLIFVIARN